MDLTTFRIWIKGGIAREGGQVKFADAKGVDRAVLSLVLTGKREPSKEFAKALGWRKETTYIREGKK